MTDYSKELNFAKILAEDAGKIMLRYIDNSIISVKDNSSPVTQADLEISQLVNSEIHKNYPSHAVLDEEIKNEIPNNEYIWVCDPLDGTIPFTNGVPTSMFSLALCKNKHPVLAVCYDPFMRRMYYSVENEAAFLNNKKIAVNTERFKKGDCVLAIPFWIDHFIQPKKFNSTLFLDLLRQKDMIVSLVESCVYSNMLVASGKIKAAIIPSAYPWDRAASKLIVQNAGGLYLDEKSQEMTVFGKHGMGVITNKAVAFEIQNIIQSCINNT